MIFFRKKVYCTETDALIEMKKNNNKNKNITSYLYSNF